MDYGQKYAGIFLVDSITYHKKVGSAPSSGSYEYQIQIGSGAQGEITPYRAGALDTESVVKFTPDEVEFVKLYELMHDKGLFARKWEARPEVTGAGPAESLKFTAFGQDYAIPSHLGAAEAASMSQVYATIRSLVPAEAWEALAK